MRRGLAVTTFMWTVIGALIFVGFLSLGRTVGSGVELTKINVASDLAYAVSGLASAEPGTVIAYPLDVSEMRISFTERCVQVKLAEDDQRTITRCYPPRGLIEPTTLVRAQSLYLIREPGAIVAQETFTTPRQACADLAFATVALAGEPLAVEAASQLSAVPLRSQDAADLTITISDGETLTATIPSGQDGFACRLRRAAEQRGLSVVIATGDEIVVRSPLEASLTGIMVGEALDG